jgi:SNF2 family DNA or RNA helicase
MRYSCDKHFIYLIDPPFHKKEEIKARFSPTWFDTNKRGKGWRVPKNLFVYRELYKFFPELKKDKDFMTDYELAAKEVTFWSRMKTDFMDNLAYHQDLRPYQNNDVHYLTKRGSALVLNEPRTGKTPTMITVMKNLSHKRNIVICPSSLVLNWAKEFSIWYPEMKVFAVNGTKKHRQIQYTAFSIPENHNSNRVLIISKDTWKLKKELHDMQFDVAIVDEAHFLRNWKSTQSQAIFDLKANIKYALTGTPAVKHGSDIYGLLHFINPEQYTSFWQFTDRYWDIEDNGWGKDLGDAKGYREEELKTIMAMNSVQRKRKEVMKWLPAVTHQTIPIEMDKEQVKLYDQMFDTFMASEGEGDELHGVDTMNKLTQLMRLRQLCLDPRLLGFKPVGAKTKALLEFAEGMSDPFVVFTTFSSYFDLVKPDLEKLGKKVGVIDGSVSKSNRQKLVEQFQNGRFDVLLCNIIAAGTGLTLDRSDTVIFLDKAFNPADNEQAQDRIVPTTKERYHPINVISLVVSGTIDERVNEILDRKEDLTKLINKSEIFT